MLIFDISGNGGIVVNVGIIGTGARATAYAQLCTSDIREDVFVKALSDIDMEKMKLFSARYFGAGTAPELYEDYNELLDDGGIDAVFICTPDTTHREIAIAALKKGKHILLEKPLATTFEDCVQIYAESLKYDSVFRMGFVLRYTDIYSKIKEIVDSGELGKLISMEAKETLGYVHAGSFFRRWHRFRKNNGGFLNAKCSHDMDLLNWIAGAEPVYVSAFGSRTYFYKRDGAAARCRECRLKNDCRYYFKSEAFGAFSSVEDLCVYNSEKDIVDHEVVNIEYEDGLTACFTVTMLSAEANRTMTVFGSDATLHADFAGGTIAVKYIRPRRDATYSFNDAEYGHGGGDRGIYENFIDSIRTDRHTMKSDARAGLLSTAIALAAEICMEEKKVIDLRSILKCD